jgi:hypothetical protein
MATPSPFTNIGDNTIKSVQSILFNYSTSQGINLSRIACYDDKNNNISLATTGTVAYSNNQIPGLANDGFNTDYSKGSFYTVYGTFWKTYPPSNVTQSDLFSQFDMGNFQSRGAQQWLLLVFPAPVKLTKIVIYNQLSRFDKKVDGQIVSALDNMGRFDGTSKTMLIPVGEPGIIGLQVAAYSSNILADLNTQTNAGYNLPLATPIWARKVVFNSDAFSLGVNGDGAIVGYLPGATEIQDKPSVVSYTFKEIVTSPPAVQVPEQQEAPRGPVVQEGASSIEPPSPSPPPPQPTILTTKAIVESGMSNTTIIIIIVIMLILLGGSGFGIYYYKKHRK